MANVTTVNVPQGDFVTTTLIGAITNASTSFTIGSGLNLDANGGFLQIDYDSTTAVGVDTGPETVAYTSYNSGTGAVTGITRAQGGTTAVAHNNGTTVQCGTSSMYYLNGTTLGETESTSLNQSGINTETDINGLSTTVTVPAGGRRIRVTTSLNIRSSNSGDVFDVRIKEGSTQLQATTVSVLSSNITVLTIYTTVPTAASHTYKVSVARVSGSGTATVASSAGYLAFILVELI